MARFILRAKAIVLYWVSIAIVILPSFLKIPIYRCVYGYRIGKHVRIGLSWIHVGRLEIGDYVSIGHLNRFKGIPDIRIGDYTLVGNGNTFTSTTEFTDSKGIAIRGNQPALLIGEHCGISIQHYFDVQDMFTIGAFTTIAGVGSVFFTHYLDVMKSSQETRPISIGNYCMIGSSARFLPGASVSDCCVVGMGAVVTKPFEAACSFVAGNPACVIRSLPEDAVYFHREVGFVSSVVQPP